jgi:hemoglobin-like flavoprotein
MNQNDIQLIKSSWGWILIRRDKAADLFYDKLFQVAPSVRPLFPKDMTLQKQKLIDSISVVVNNLNKVEDVKETLMELGKRHRKYGAVTAHYAVVADVLIATLQEGMGDRFTQEAKVAWQKALNIINSVMIEGASY